LVQASDLGSDAVSAACGFDPRLRQLRLMAKRSGHKAARLGPAWQCQGYGWRQGLRCLRGHPMATKHRRNGYYIFRPWITTRTGHRIYAWQYGKKAFKIWIAL
jgi:hypothetical protein